MDRRDAIKRIGALAAVAAIGSTGLAGASGLTAEKVPMKILAINKGVSLDSPAICRPRKHSALL